MSERRLISIRRSVPAAAGRTYDELWSRLQQRVSGAGANAWRFRSTATPGLCLEFLEFRASGADPRARREVADCLAALDRCAPGTLVEEWIGG